METKLSKDKSALYYARTWWKLPFRQHGYYVKDASDKTFTEGQDIDVAKAIAATMNLIAKHSN